MSRIIRGRSVVPGELVEAREEADALLESARAEAAKLVEEAKAQAQSLRDEASRLGREEARAEVAALLLEAKTLRDETLREAEPTIRKLAMAVARRVLRAELELHPEKVVPMVAEVLDRARRAKEVTIRAHPSNVERIRSLERARDAVVEADESLTEGCCIVETELGRLDGRIEVQLAALERALG